MKKYDLVIGEVNRVLGEYDMPLTLRQIYYRLVAGQVIENTINQYKWLSRVLVKARELGDVDGSHIEDRTRYINGGDSGYTDPDNFVEDQIIKLKELWMKYARPMWANQDYYLETWVEKDALSRLVSAVADKFNVMTCVARGYSSYTFVKDAVDRLNTLENDDKKRVILYLGDFDPSGEDMVRDLSARLQKYGAGNFEIEKIALTKEQIETNNLPPAPTKKTDIRSTKFIEEHGDMVVELDALEPPILQDMIGSAIQRHINVDVWNSIVEKSDLERAEIKNIIDKKLKRLEG